MVAYLSRIEQRMRRTRWNVSGIATLKSERDNVSFLYSFYIKVSPKLSSTQLFIMEPIQFHLLRLQQQPTTSSTRRRPYYVLYVFLLFFFVDLTSCNTIINLGDRAWYIENTPMNLSFRATVPGSVHTALLENRYIENPYVGLRDDEYAWIADEEWVYQNYFECK